MRTAGRVLVAIAVVLLVQSTVGLDLRVAGAHPELVWLLPIAAGLVAGPDAGALVGFVSGVVLDLFLPTPFGLTALVGCLLGFAVGRIAVGSSVQGRWAGPVAALVGSAAAVMLYAVLGAVLGQQQMLHVDLGAVVGVVAVCNALVAPLVARLMRWALGIPSGRRDRRAVAGAPW